MMPMAAGASMDSMSMDFAGIPDARDASGTAWQPDDTPMHAHHSMAGDWALMTHYNVFVAYEDQPGPRGGDQFNSINWLMLMGTRRTEADEITLRAMFSLEPWTVTRQGYPLLFQSGEAFHGTPLVDRQHPHDFFMELAARYRHALSQGNLISLYVAPSGEPALGPAAFPHRMSAMDNPAAPISHHWLDSTHISFGVLTAGYVHRNWQIEGSWFNGREPDDDRWDLEKPKLDSYSARFTFNPSPAWSAQGSAGYLKSPQELHPEDDVRRTTASLTHVTTLSNHSHLAALIGWGRNRAHGESTDAFLAEANWSHRRYAIFGRAEYVEKTGEELQIPPDDRRIPVKQFTLGATRELVSGRPYQLALGASATYSIAPADLDPFYDRHPLAYWVFIRLRPAAMH